MVTRQLSFLLSSLLLAAACGEPEPPPVTVDDDSWDQATSEQRAAHLREALDTNLEVLRTTQDAGRWHAAAGKAVRSLSLLRVEGRDADPDAYAELEAEVERLTDEPPLFAQPR